MARPGVGNSFAEASSFLIEWNGTCYHHANIVSRSTFAVFRRSTIHFCAAGRMVNGSFGKKALKVDTITATYGTASRERARREKCEEKRNFIPRFVRDRRRVWCARTHVKTHERRFAFELESATRGNANQVQCSLLIVRWPAPLKRCHHKNSFPVYRWLVVDVWSRLPSACSQLTTEAHSEKLSQRENQSSFFSISLIPTNISMHIFRVSLNIM